MNYEIEKGLLNCGNKNQRLNLTHVDDVVDGLMQAIRVVTTENYREFQISAPNSLTLEELVKVIEKYRDCNIPVAYGKLQNRRQILNLWQCAKAVPNFIPRRTLSEFLTRARQIEKY